MMMFIPPPNKAEGKTKQTKMKKGIWCSLTCLESKAAYAATVEASKGLGSTYVVDPVSYRTHARCLDLQHLSNAHPSYNLHKIKTSHAWQIAILSNSPRKASG